MAPHQSLRVDVRPPRVRGSTVRFSWEQDRANPFQHRNGWSVRYDGVDLGRFHRAVLWDVLLSLQLPVWASQAQRVELRIPEPVPRVVLDWWRAYHGAEHVTATGPLTDADAYRPLPHDSRSGAGECEVAVSYGGGKDSTFALHALLAGRRPEQVLLLHVVQPFGYRRLEQWRTRQRSLRTVVRPAVDVARVPAQVVVTDVLAVLSAEGRRVRPDVNLYTAATLPALLHHGARAVTVSRTVTTYRVGRTVEGARTWPNPSARPERLAALGAYYENVLGVRLRPESTHYALGELVSFGALLRLHPQAFARIVMCMRTTSRRRWCLDCAKCMEYALFGLALGHQADDLDYDVLLGESRYVRRLVAIAQEEQELQEGRMRWHGNASYVRDIGAPAHFGSFCHALRRADPDTAGVRLGDAARENLRALRRAWGNAAFPAVEQIHRAALDAAGPLGREVALRAAAAFPVVDEPGSPLLVGNGRAEFAHGESMPMPAVEAMLRRWPGPPSR